MLTLLDAFHFVALPPKAEQFREDIRAFLRDELPPAPADVRARSWMGFDGSFSRRLARRGWVGASLPSQYGGSGMDAFHRFVLVEELLAAGAPVSAHWIADRQSGPLILKYGSNAQKQFFLPRICAAQAFFCIGMSEPDSGSDLASIRTRATRCTDGWQLNGRKIWTTNAQHCDYMIALVRTSGTVEARRDGLSQFVIDLKQEGVTVRPIVDLTGDVHFAEVSFENVLLPDDALIGNEGDGWMQVNAELAFERSGPERIYSSVVLLNLWSEHLRRINASGADVILAGRLTSHLVTLRNMSIAVAAKLVHGESPVAEAALVKDIGTQFEQLIPAAIAAAVSGETAGNVGLELYRTIEYLCHIAPTFSLRGGTREILRGLIARSLGLR